MHSRNGFLSDSLKGEIIGLEEVGDSIWNIVYFNTILGRIELQAGGVTGIDKVQTICSTIHLTLRLDASPAEEQETCDPRDEQQQSVRLGKR